MIPTKEFDQLVPYYKGEITDNALLNKAGRLAAESHLLLNDKSIPDSMAVKMVKPLARERVRLTKRLRDFSTSASSGDVAEEDSEKGSLTSDTFDAMLKQIIKNTSRKRKGVDVDDIVKTERITPTRKKKFPSPPTLPLSVIKEFQESGGKPVKRKTPKPKPITSSSKTPRETLHEELLQTLQGRKKKKTEVERLKPLSGWEDWAQGKKLKRTLEYDEDEQEEED